VIQNPKTGEILAMASYPDFDPNLLAQGSLPANFDLKKLKNPIVSHLYEPGSTFKIVTLAAAIEEGLYTPKDMIYCENGKWKCAGTEIKDHEPSGVLTFS